ncbi:VOC family protein [Sorangium sp. So ce176]|uniref:VOC family protein n=1 Tax=Sorangium sp. So ce176 TaxID=3133286 RepID=UPI003F64898D
MNGGPHFKFNEAISIAVTCEMQEEVDELWSKLTSKALPAPSTTHGRRRGHAPWPLLGAREEHTRSAQGSRSGPFYRLPAGSARHAPTLSTTRHCGHWHRISTLPLLVARTISTRDAGRRRNYFDEEFTIPSPSLPRTERGRPALMAATRLDQERQALYFDVVLSSLNEAARRSLEEKMKSGYEFQSDFARSYVAKGRLEEAACAVLTVLEARGLAIPPEVRERVLASSDMAELDRWLRRAAVIAEVSALLDMATS